MRNAMSARHSTNRLNAKRSRGFSDKTNKQIVIDRDIRRGVYADIDNDDYDTLDYTD